MLLWAVKDKYFSFIGYFSKNILIFFSFLYRSIEPIVQKRSKICREKNKRSCTFLFYTRPFGILCVWYGKNLQSLHIVQTFIVTVFLKQLFVFAAFYDTAFIEYINAVGILDSRQAMCDSNSSAGLHQTFQSFLYQTFTFCIKGRSSFVQNQDGWVFQDGTGYRDTLTLSS